MHHVNSIGLICTTCGSKISSNYKLGQGFFCKACGKQYDRSGRCIIKFMDKAPRVSHRRWDVEGNYHVSQVNFD